MNIFNSLLAQLVKYTRYFLSHIIILLVQYLQSYMHTVVSDDCAGWRTSWVITLLPEERCDRVWCALVAWSLGDGDIVEPDVKASWWLVQRHTADTWWTWPACRHWLVVSPVLSLVQRSPCAVVYSIESLCVEYHIFMQITCILYNCSVFTDMFVMLWCTMQLITAPRSFTAAVSVHWHVCDVVMYVAVDHCVEKLHCRGVSSLMMSEQLLHVERCIRVLERVS